MKKDQVKNSFNRIKNDKKLNYYTETSREFADVS